MGLQKYVGRTVDIIYCDHNNKITKRRVDVKSLYGNNIKVFCHLKQAPRIFKFGNILAIEPISRKRSG